MIRRSQILYMFLTFATLFLLIFHNPIVAEFQVRVSPNSIGHIELQYWRKMASFSQDDNLPIDYINMVNLGLLIASAVSSLLAILYSRHIKNQNIFIVTTFVLVVSFTIVSYVDFYKVKSDLGETAIKSIINVNLFWLILVAVFSLLALIKTLRMRFSR